MCYGAEFTAKDVRGWTAAAGTRTAYTTPSSPCANDCVGSFNVPLRDELVALLVIGHPMNGVAFRACVEQHLVPTLPPGDFVAADSLQCHKSPSVRAAIDACGAELRYLPPYPPDLSPIEQVFAKLKAFVRIKAWRNVKSLWATIGQCLARFTAVECSNYLADSGYSRLM
jgi:transposase InsO family protein